MSEGVRSEGGFAPRAVHRVGPGVVSIGRSRANDIVVDDLLASRSHAELLVGRGGTELVDLESANGTFLNGRRISRAIITRDDVSRSATTPSSWSARNSSSTSTPAT